MQTHWFNSQPQTTDLMWQHLFFWNFANFELYHSFYLILLGLIRRRTKIFKRFSSFCQLFLVANQIDYRALLEHYKDHMQQQKMCHTCYKNSVWHLLKKNCFALVAKKKICHICCKKFPCESVRICQKVVCQTCCKKFCVPLVAKKICVALVAKSSVSHLLQKILCRTYCKKILRRTCCKKILVPTCCEKYIFWAFKTKSISWN